MCTLLEWGWIPMIPFANGLFLTLGFAAFGGPQMRGDGWLGVIGMSGVILTFAATASIAGIMWWCKPVATPEYIGPFGHTVLLFGLWGSAGIAGLLIGGGIGAIRGKR